MALSYGEVTLMVAEESPDFIYLADPNNYELIYLNRTTRELYDLQSENQWLKKPCYQILQHRNSPCPFCTNTALHENRFLTWTFHNPVLKMDLLVKDKLVNLNGKLLRLEVATDITHQMCVERELQRRVHTLETLMRCVQTMDVNNDIDYAIQELLRYVSEFHDAQRGYVFELNRENVTLSNTHEWCKAGVSAQIDHLQNLPKTLTEVWLEHFEQTNDFYISSLQDVANNLTKDEYDLLHMQDIQCLMAAALRVDGEIVGFLGVDNPSVYTDDMMLLRSVAAFISNDLKKSLMIRELERLSLTDSLTGLYNRHMYMRNLEEMSQNRPTTLGVVFADINGLKQANDTNGHRYGDSLISRTAEILNQCFQKHLYRLGGDEFLVLCPNMPRQEFYERTQKLKKLLSKDSHLKLAIGTSWESAQVDPVSQIATTDSLMYEEKERSRSSEAENKQ